MKIITFSSLGIIFVIMVAFMITPAVASDFETFAKAKIKEFGHNSDPKLITYAINEYIEESNVKDPIDFFNREMESVNVIHSNDSSLSQTDRAYFQSGKVKKITSFSKSYFNRVITSYELSVLVYELFTGEIRITARIYLNAP